MPAGGKAPTRLGISVRVQERWGAKRTGIITGHAVGDGTYMVDFDGEEGSPEEKSNKQLRIYKEAYGKQKAPVSKIAATIRAALPKTGRRQRRRKNNGIEENDVGASDTDRESPIDLEDNRADKRVVNDSDEDLDSLEENLEGIEVNLRISKRTSVDEDDADDSDGVEVSILSSHGKYTPTSEEDDDDSDNYDDDISQSSSSSQSSASLETPKETIFSSVKKKLARRRKNESASSVRRRLYSNDDDDGMSSREGEDELYIQEEGEGFDNKFEDDEEDDDGRGTAILVGEGDTGNQRDDFIDEPQKRAAYIAANDKYLETKEDLIEKRAIFPVKVSSTKSYVVGGRVVGRATSQFDGSSGTISEVVRSDTYMIHWDDKDRAPCEARKTQLRLSKEPDKVYKWEVIRDNEPKNPPSSYAKHGVIDFEASKFATTDRDSVHYDFPYGRMLEALWPGDWRKQKEMLNASMEKTNIETKQPRKLKPATDEEWWGFIGIILFAVKAGNGGINHLYGKSEQLLKELPQINLKEIMPEYRMKQLLKHFPDSFHGDNESDPWNAVTGIVNGFNQNRANKVAASFTKLMDELISSWNPTTTKYGGLPNLSFIMRKPKPLGTEFKAMADALTSEFVYGTL